LVAGADRATAGAVGDGAVDEALEVGLGDRGVEGVLGEDVGQVDEGPGGGGDGDALPEPVVVARDSWTRTPSRSGCS
jgi:hypothetical protein